MQRLSYMSVPRRRPYRYSTLVDAFRQDAGTYRETEIAIHREPGNFRKTVSKSELENDATKLAMYLVMHGVKKGDNVAIFGPNSLQWMVGELAILMAGAVSVHLTVNTKDTKQTLEFLSAAHCKFLILDFGEKDELKDVVSELLSQCQENVVDPEDETKAPSCVLMRPLEAFPTVPSFNSIKNRNDITATLPLVYPEDTAIIFPSSGSTGEPKLLKHSHFAFLNGFELVDYFYASATVYNDRPFSWLGGYPFTYICSGKSIVFTNASHALKPGSSGIIWDMIKKEKCTHALLMPYILNDLVHDMENYSDDFKLKCILTGGQIVDKAHAKVIGKYCETMLTGYGCSEAMGISLKEEMTSADVFDTGNVGRPYPGNEIKFVDDEGNPVKRGEMGLLLCRSRYIFQGYYNPQHSTSDVISADGWFNTGDIGYITSSDEIIIKGRAKDVISRGTRKIIPSAIENVILKMPSIVNVSVIAVPDKRLYEEICVCYVSESQDEISPNTMEEYCKSMFTSDLSYDGLGDMPRYFLQFSEIPMLPNGKPDKITLKSEAITRLKLS